MDHMKQYPCFASEQWKTEFAKFEEQHRLVWSNRFLDALGTERFVSEYLQVKLARHDWLS